MRLAKVGASLVLVGVMTAACGGGSGPDDADSDEFCEAWKNVGQTVVDDGNDFDKVKDAYEDAFDVGTPDGISDDAREGFEILEETISDVDDEEEAKEAEEPKGEDGKKVEEFGKFQQEECGDSLTPDIETPDVPSDPSDIPSDAPTE